MSKSWNWPRIEEQLEAPGPFSTQATKRERERERERSERNASLQTPDWKPTPSGIIFVSTDRSCTSIYISTALPPSGFRSSFALCCSKSSRHTQNSDFSPAGSLKKEKRRSEKDEELLGLILWEEEEEEEVEVEVLLISAISKLLR
jgi:hypothetical protein